MSTINLVEGWQRSRLLDKQPYDPWQSLYNVMEETFEGLGFASGMSKHFAYKYQELIKIDWENSGSPKPSPEDIIDSKCDQMVFAIGDIMKLGYSPEASLQETYEEISSRRQLPSQQADWEVNGPSGKWQKDSLQNPDSLYKADYSKCTSYQEDAHKLDMESLREDLLNG